MERDSFSGPAGLSPPIGLHRGSASTARGAFALRVSSIKYFILYSFVCGLYFIASTSLWWAAIQAITCAASFSSPRSPPPRSEPAADAPNPPASGGDGKLKGFRPAPGSAVDPMLVAASTGFGGGAGSGGGAPGFRDVEVNRCDGNGGGI